MFPPEWHDTYTEIAGRVLDPAKHRQRLFDIITFAMALGLLRLIVIDPVLALVWEFIRFFNGDEIDSISAQIRYWNRETAPVAKLYY